MTYTPLPIVILYCPYCKKIAPFRRGFSECLDCEISRPTPLSEDVEDRKACKKCID